ncbi:MULTISPECIES: DUF5994 family protein [unclassified Streptomyces]|uniref:DUF5994 family protein n=1 Tax=unclassified Streptomyces TaxID=2593676 RepID=UPI0036AB75B3
MSATYEDRELPRQKQQDDIAPRLALKGPTASGGLLDGAWWPRSRDLARELPGLVDALEPLWGRVTRVAVNPAHWDAVPRHVAGRGHVVKVGWFTQELDPHKVLLLSYSVGRWDLLVVPPGTGTAAAERLMAAASDPGAAPLTASALIAAEESRHGADAPGTDTETTPVRDEAPPVPSASAGDESTPVPSASARDESTPAPSAPVRDESTPVPEDDAVAGAVAVPVVAPGPPAPLVAGT